MEEKDPGGKKSVKLWEGKVLGGKRVSGNGSKMFQGEKECQVTGGKNSGVKRV